MVVGFIGLGAMGGGMASALVKAGLQVYGFDVYEPAMARLKAAGGKSADSPAHAAEAARVLVVMVTNSSQAEDVLWGPRGAVAALPPGATIVLCSTVPPDYVRQLASRLTAVHLVDAPVSGGVAKAAQGQLTIMAAGSAEALRNAAPVLEAMSGQLYVIGDQPGAASSVKMVNQLLAGAHIATAAEAMALGAKVGLNPRLVFEVVKNAAGNSWMFENRVPHMLDGDWTPHSALTIFVKDLGIVLGEARRLGFPTPLAATAHQQFLLGASAGLGREDDSAVVKIWERMGAVQVATPPAADSDAAALRAAVDGGPTPSRVGFIGLGSMGQGMAAALACSGMRVSSHAMDKWRAAGGVAATSSREAVKGASVVVLMVATSEQAEDVLFGREGVATVLEAECCVVVCSTVDPAFVQQAATRLEAEGRSLFLVDAPVSGGVARAAAGKLTIMAAGCERALTRGGAVLKSMAEHLYIIPGGVGQGSRMKMVHQVLAGTHVALAGEAMALAAGAGLDTKQVFEIITNAAGNSWMFENRVPRMLAADFPSRGSIDLHIKDLSIALGEAARLSFPLPMASTARQQFLAAAALGFRKEDDSAVVKVYERLTGVSVASNPQPPQPLPKESTLGSLPPEWSGPNATEASCGGSDVLVVLDDDPTGTQTVHNVAVLTEWGIPCLEKELAASPSCFFILTNSRALPTDQAAQLTRAICRNVAAAAESAGRRFTIVLRGDSTLRGHFPQEAEAAAEVVGGTDAWLLCPFFLQGGRYTIGDVHYVTEGDRLVPAGQTEFAKDDAFGYKSSNLKKWVEEKSGGRIPADRVASISIDTIRGGGPEAVCRQLCSLNKGSVCILNAASEGDMAVLAAGIRKAEVAGKQFLCRTAASFVSARLGLHPRPPLTPADLSISRGSPSGRHGGLIIVGSYVPKTTKQVQALLVERKGKLETITLDVEILSRPEGDAARESVIATAAATADAVLARGRDTVVMTGRDLLRGKDGASSLAIGARVSSALVAIVRRIQTRPRYILAKGGITSSDIATKGLDAVRAMVVGQAAAGVPLWRLGPTSRHPGVPYIVFPGNVGGTDALAQVVTTWSQVPPVSTMRMLEAAESGGYAVGAFNVYNLEGVAAVVGAAEALDSPAILQIHPGSLREGGAPLVAACRAAAEGAKVPIAVHLDHANKEEELMAALELEEGFDSVMVDGSELPYVQNVAFTQRVMEAAGARGMGVEAELGRLSGSEDGETVAEYEAHLTDVKQADEFLAASGVKCLAVCVGNVHGKYPPEGPNIDLDRLKRLRDVCVKHGAVVVLHGASGLPHTLVQECVKLGVRKFNVNTEVRAAYMKSLVMGGKDVVDVMRMSKAMMQEVVEQKMQMFGSAGKGS